MGNYIVVQDANEWYSAGEILLLEGRPMYVTMILGDKVYLRHLGTFEWVGYHARRLMKKIGIK